MRVFGSASGQALKVFACESGYNPAAVGDSSLASTLRYKAAGLPYGSSYGVAQIRYLPGRPSPEKLLDPYTNIRYAKKLYDAQGWGPWSCARNLGIR